MKKKIKNVPLRIPVLMHTQLCNLQTLGKIKSLQAAGIEAFKLLIHQKLRNLTEAEQAFVNSTTAEQLKQLGIGREIKE